MKKTNMQKVELLLADERVMEQQKALLKQYVLYAEKFKSTDGILETLYNVRDFALFIKKPFQEAVRCELESFLDYKIKDKQSTITDNRPVAVKDKSANCYRYRIQGFYRWMKKFTEHKIDEELAYPLPKIIVKEEVPRAEKFRRRVIKALNESNLSQANLKTLNEYYNYKKSSGLVTSDIGFSSKLNFLKNYGLFLKEKTFKEATRNDIQEFIMLVRNRNDGKFNDSYKAHLLDFYRYVYDMFGSEQPRTYPDVVSWLYTKRKKINDRLAKEIIPDSDIQSMLKVTANQEERCIISVLRDSSARVGELVNCNIEDAIINSIGNANGKYEHQIAQIKLKGKTGERINQLFWSVPDLRLWLMQHPLRDNPKAPLFISAHPSRYGQRLTPAGINKMLHRVSNRAGVKKHIHAHKFRHTNITKMASVLSESELKIHAGWGACSKMAEVYIHLTSNDVNKKILRSMGIELEEEKGAPENLLQVKVCPNNICSFENPSEAKFCLQCGYPLSMKTAIELKKLKEDEEQLQQEIMSKGLCSIQLGQNLDIKEAMYQILKSDKQLVDKLRKLVQSSETVT